MPIVLHATAPGRPATAALSSAVARAKQHDVLAPVTVVVPTNYVSVSVRRRLAADGGLIGVQFLTLYRLAELLGAPSLAAAGRRPVSGAVIGAAVRAVLQSDPGRFASVADHPATEQALVRTHRVLSELPATARRAVAESGPLAGDVVRMHDDVRARLRRHWHDEADLCAAALAVLDAAAADGGGSRSLASRLGAVVVHLPERLTAAGAALLRRLADTATVDVVVALHGHDDADRATRRIAEQLGVSVPAAEPSAPVVDHVVAAPDADDEVRAAVRNIVAAVSDGTPLDRIAMLYGTAEPYARIVHEQLRAAGLAHNGRAVRPVSESIAGRFVLGATALHQHRWRRDEVFAVLGEAPLHDGDGPIPVAEWERLSRAAGIVASLDQWRERLALHRDDLDRDDERRRAQGRPPNTGARRSLDRFSAFLAVLQELLDPEPRSWGALGHASARLLAMLDDGEGNNGWPDEERSALDTVAAAVERLTSLDAVDPMPVTLDVFHRALEVELDGALARVGRFGDGILVGHVGMGLGLDLDLVVILGLAEGVFPQRRGDDTLLPDRARAAVPHGLLPMAADHSGEDHRHLLSALAAVDHSDGRAIATWPRGDLRGGGDRVPSRWLVDLVRTRTGRPVTGDSVHALADEPWYDEIASFEGSLLGLDAPATPAEYDLAALTRHVADGGRLDTHPLVDGALAAGLDTIRARASGAFTRFDGNLAHVVGRAPVLDPGASLSATGLERYARCPHAFFLADVLGIRPVENPETVLELSALDSGSLVHEVIDIAIRHQIDTGTALSPDLLHTALDQLGDDLAARGLTGKNLLWQRLRRQLRRELSEFVDRDSRRLAGLGAHPVASEHDFGMYDSDAAPVVVTLGDHAVVRFRGSVDRIDEREDGRLIVTDYKTGRSERYRGIADGDPVEGGQRLQLVLYALAARQYFGDDRPVYSQYWFISERGGWRDFGYEVDDRTVERFRHVVTTIVHGIASGLFPARAPEPSSRPSRFRECVYCDPDGLGTAERHREFLRMVDAPELAPLWDLWTHEETLA